jgi:hypothetical protein
MNRPKGDDPCACQYAQPSQVRTNCVHYDRNPIPVCTN